MRKQARKLFLQDNARMTVGRRPLDVFAELAGAAPLHDNGFKVELARRTVVAVLGELTGAGA